MFPWKNIGRKFSAVYKASLPIKYDFKVFFVQRLKYEFKDGFYEIAVYKKVYTASSLG